MPKERKKVQEICGNLIKKIKRKEEKKTELNAKIAEFSRKENSNKEKKKKCQVLIERNN